MSQFHIINEGTEDGFGTTDDLPKAIELAREAATQGQAGDPVSVLDPGGMAVWQCVLLPNGTVEEQPIATPAQGIIRAPLAPAKRGASGTD